jgi:hypothetical protein
MFKKYKIGISSKEIKKEMANLCRKLLFKKFKISMVLINPGKFLVDTKK